MSRRVFVSYRFRDRETAKTLNNFFQMHGRECDGVPVYVEQDLSGLGHAAVDEVIRSVMEECVLVLLVVGNDSHNAPWIDRELELADSKALPIVAVRLPNTTGAPPPRIRGRDIPLVAWGPDALCAALNRVKV